MTQAAIDMLTEEIEREREFQTTDEWDGESDIVPVLEEMLAQIRAGNAPTTSEEVEAFAMKIYDATANDFTGDTDLADGIAEELAKALGIAEEEFDE